MRLGQRIERLTRKYKRVEYEDSSFVWYKEKIVKGRTVPKMVEVTEDEKQLLEQEYQLLNSNKGE